MLVGAVYSGTEAQQLVVAMSGPIGSLASAIIAGLATILALMLTMLGLSRRLEQGIGMPFYRRIERTALLAIVDMVGALALMLILSSPIQKTSEQAYQAGGLVVTLTYYLLLVLTALVAGLFMAIIVMLYNAIQTVIEAVSTPD